MVCELAAVGSRQIARQGRNSLLYFTGQDRELFGASGMWSLHCSRTDPSSSRAHDEMFECI